jgi:hypothetical protein
VNHPKPHLILIPINMSIAGIETQPWMVQYAKDHAPKNIAHALDFDTYNAKGELPYAFRLIA